MGEPDREIIENALRRLVDRLHSASLPRLTRADDRLGGQSLADASYELACWSASAYEAVMGVQLPTPTRLNPFASGDQVHVTVRELLDALDEVGDGRAGVDGVLRQLSQRVDELRAAS